MCSFNVYLVALVLASASICKAAGTEHPAPPVLAETVQVPGGAELITYFQNISSDHGQVRIPLLSVLKDTLGDDDDTNDRLREVWVFTYRQPSVWRRAAGAVPFLYTRAPLPDTGTAKPPKPVLDMGAPSKGLWKGVAGAVIQTQLLDPVGAAARLSSRSYAGNIGEYRRMHVWQALDVLEAMPDDAGQGLTHDELRMIQGRLELSSRLFGGLVSDEYLERAYEKSRARQMEARAGNWDLLRQRAEDNGLYFQPVSVAGLPSSWAMLWLADSDLGKDRPFDSKFLGISNPFRDSSLTTWKGYCEEWWLDSAGSVSAAGEPGARPVRMIPLALYALDHPRAPLLLADMRRSDGPKWAERRRRFTADMATSLLGFSGYGRWAYMGVKAGYGFVRGRHGMPVERQARLRAYVQIQHALAADTGLNPALRSELARRVDALDINPMEHNWAREAESARAQYQAFVEYAQSPQGLARRLKSDRDAEARAAIHGAGERALIRIATFASFGAYRHSERLGEGDSTKLEAKRREAYERRQAAVLPPAPSAGAGTHSTFEEVAQ